MSQPDLEEALLLLRKAREDIDAVKKLTPDSEIADSVFAGCMAVVRNLRPRRWRHMLCL
ncbi:MAG TPA: hypothetical protein VK790_08645 [Solirubrobacteraceae bacterium]|nr:hypothetical protein [Solirubrobacteraceae bacterium]